MLLRLKEPNTQTAPRLVEPTTGLVAVGQIGSCIDLCLQGYGKQSSFVGVYVRPQSLDIKPFLQRVEESKTYEFGSDISKLVRLVPIHLAGLDQVDRVLLETVVGPTLITERATLVDQGLHQFCYGPMNKDEIFQRIDRLYRSIEQRR